MDKPYLISWKFYYTRKLDDITRYKLVYASSEEEALKKFDAVMECKPDRREEWDLYKVGSRSCQTIE